MGWRGSEPGTFEVRHHYSQRRRFAEAGENALGLLRVLCTVIPFLYIRTVISKNIAALLEEHDIFVPETMMMTNKQVMKFRKEKALAESRNGGIRTHMQCLNQ